MPHVYDAANSAYVSMAESALRQRDYNTLVNAINLIQNDPGAQHRLLRRLGEDALRCRDYNWVSTSIGLLLNYPQTRNALAESLALDALRVRDYNWVITAIEVLDISDRDRILLQLGTEALRVRDYNWVMTAVGRIRDNQSKFKLLTQLSEEATRIRDYLWVNSAAAELRRLGLTGYVPAPIATKLAAPVTNSTAVKAAVGNARSKTHGQSSNYGNVPKIGFAHINKQANSALSKLPDLLRALRRRVLPSVADRLINESHRLQSILSALDVDHQKCTYNIGSLSERVTKYERQVMALTETAKRQVASGDRDDATRTVTELRHKQAELDKLASLLKSAESTRDHLEERISLAQADARRLQEQADNLLLTQKVAKQEKKTAVKAKSKSGGIQEARDKLNSLVGKLEDDVIRAKSAAAAQSELLQDVVWPKDMAAAAEAEFELALFEQQHCNTSTGEANPVGAYDLPRHTAILAHKYVCSAVHTNARLGAYNSNDWWVVGGGHEELLMPFPSMMASKVFASTHEPYQICRIQENGRFSDINFFLFDMLNQSVEAVPAMLMPRLIPATPWVFIVNPTPPNRTNVQDGDEHRPFVTPIHEQMKQDGIHLGSLNPACQYLWRVLQIVKQYELDATVGAFTPSEIWTSQEYYAFQSRWREEFGFVNGFQVHPSGTTSAIKGAPDVFVSWRRGQVDRDIHVDILDAE